MSRLHDESKRLFTEALALGIDERAAFLDRACRGDEELRREVESLLDHHDESKLDVLDESERPAGLRTALRSMVRSWVGPAEPPPPERASDRPEAER